MKSYGRNIYRLIAFVLLFQISGCAAFHKDGEVLSSKILKSGQIDYQRCKATHTFEKGRIIVTVTQETKTYDQAEQRIVSGVEVSRVRVPINQEVVSQPFANHALSLTLPSNHVLQAVTDQEGRAVFDIPDRPDLVFPLKNLGILDLPLKRYGVIDVPSKDAHYEITVDKNVLEILPPTVFARAEELAEKLRQARQQRNVARSEYNDHVKPLEDAYLAVRPSYSRCTIYGKIQNWDENTLQIWGTANPDEFMGDGYAPEATNLIIIDYDRQMAKMTGYTNYRGDHYFLKKTSGKGYFGQAVPVRVYGPKPKEKGRVLAARRKWEKAVAKYKPPYDLAEVAVQEATAVYIKNLPTDPFEIN